MGARHFVCSSLICGIPGKEKNRGIHITRFAGKCTQKGKETLTFHKIGETLRADAAAPQEGIEGSDQGEEV